MDHLAWDLGDMFDMSRAGQRRRVIESTLVETGVWAIDRLNEYLGGEWPAGDTAYR
jgi:hypothetical protein